MRNAQDILPFSVDKILSKDFKKPGKIQLLLENSNSNNEQILRYQINMPLLN